MRSATLTILLLLATLSSAPVNAQAPSVAIPASQQHDLQSHITGRDYRLFVALPEGYTAADSLRYPVLYLLDGNHSFPLAVSALRFLRIGREVPDMIIVGVGYATDWFSETYPQRAYDYTPSRVQAYDSAESARLGVALQTGGGSSFLEFLRMQVIPFIDETYRTTADRALWGHSFGGLFAAYALLQAPPALFQGYGISSPSLGWNNGEIFGQEEKYAQSHRRLPARVFLSTGSKESEPVIRRTELLANALAGRAHEGLIIQYHIFADESHGSVIPAALARAIRQLFSP
jgi:uncharacterized protein